MNTLSLSIFTMTFALMTERDGNKATTTGYKPRQQQYNLELLYFLLIFLQGQFYIGMFLTQKALIELTLKLLGTGCSDMLTDEIRSPSGAGTYLGKSASQDV